VGRREAKGQWLSDCDKGLIKLASTFGDDERLELALLGCTLHNLALDRVPADQPEDEHGPRLPYPVCPILRLQVHLWILPTTLDPFKETNKMLRTQS
jgi:hypothetical protein